jgi:hypothetical protein
LRSSLGKAMAREVLTVVSAAPGARRGGSAEGDVAESDEEGGETGTCQKGGPCCCSCRWVVFKLKLMLIV